ncbi:hypothetical protein H8K20_02280 [Neobittarella massiliensis]|uniref:Uncharacterized protein n=1 Tax=Neobittarella massiliensis (ex Bilen et al. 2018) TaxID=2041842 RepID=A0A8J6LU39_9FIRM|nr:hypothetical protein [Neobittarella massiliensis]MBC3515220.1 hypothetical protein [Neobittarella massiliensis]
MAPSRDKKRDGCENRPDTKRPGCARTTCTYTQVELPISIQPAAQVGDIRLTCCGEPSVCCRRTCDGSCLLTFTQQLRVEVPVTYSATVEAGTIDLCLPPKDCTGK